MRREQTLEEISDGKLYDSNDMVKADCHDCEGCCDCCQGMGDSVILDPYDVHRLSVGLEKPGTASAGMSGTGSIRRKCPASSPDGR